MQTLWQNLNIHILVEMSVKYSHGYCFLKELIGYGIADNFFGL